MNKALTVSFAFATLATMACSSVAPMKIAAGDQCFRCRRYISEERVATEAIDANRFVAKFRGPGCMAKYLVNHPDEKSTLYVTDFSTGKMMTPDAGFYVSEVVDRNTNETDYRAYRVKAEADAYAAQVHTTPIGWDAVLAQAH
ncbi:MAG: hypothetical protein JF610_02415 [Acidobacteria bacterium]|nr:hypothetical protein [Acidobacteriota bacterium]